jgi:hypothetical protein
MFVDEERLLEAAQRENALPFDAPRISEVPLNHRGKCCTFEAILSDYRLHDAGLARLGLIVRAADVRGQEHVAKEGTGLTEGDCTRVRLTGHPRSRKTGKDVSGV